MQFFKKYIIAITGLFLCLFLLVHLSANMLLLLPEKLAQYSYNAYAHKLRESYLIKVVSVFLFIAIVAHAIYAFVVIRFNKRTRPKAYAMNHTLQNSSWASQNMGSLGVILLIFMVIHLSNFWMRIKLGLGENLPLDSHGHLDVYHAVHLHFQNIYYVLLYALISLPLGFHLHHGINSAFKTMGMYHKKYLALLAKITRVYTWFICLGFALIPIYMYLRGKG